MAADEYDVDAQRLTRDEVIALLRGPAGSSVSVVVGGPPSLDGTGEEGATVREVTLERRTLPQPPLKEVATSIHRKSHSPFRNPVNARACGCSVHPA